MFRKRKLNAVPGDLSAQPIHPTEPEPLAEMIQWMGDTLLTAIRLSPKGANASLAQQQHVASLELRDILELVSGPAERATEAIKRANVILCGQATLEPTFADRQGEDQGE